MPMDCPTAEAKAAALLGSEDPEPVGELNATLRSPFFLVCDHAGNAVPAALSNLGLPREELQRHIALDLGALAVAQGLARRLQAPLVFQRYSRLVIDCNRKPEAPDSTAATADGTMVPGNRDLDASARRARVAELLQPYHRCITQRLDARAAEGLTTLLVSVHSFTPSLRARPVERPWDLGLCWGHDRRFTDRVLHALEGESDLCIGANQPYDVDLVNDYSIPVHGEGRGLPYVEFEIRQDHLTTPAETEAWAERLARVLQSAAAGFDPASPREA